MIIFIIFIVLRKKYFGSEDSFFEQLKKLKDECL